MKLHNGIHAFSPPPTGVVLTIGNFDGVHRGHQRIIATARDIAQHTGGIAQQKGGSAHRQGGLPVVAMTFEPHPREILTPHRAPPRLTPRADKLEYLAHYGVDETIVLASEPALFARSAADFLADVTGRCRPVALVEGASFSFGCGREGSVEMLARCAEQLGYLLTVVDTFLCEDLPGKPGVSSSAVRDAVSRGDVQTAAAMLGRPYRIRGMVTHGAGRGATIGFPTANLDGVEQLVPGEAVYAATARTPDGALRPAAVNIGPQPTFGDSQRRIEAHLLDFAGDLRSSELHVHFLKRLRGQQRFASAAELTEQLRRDVAATRACAAERA